MLSITTKTTRTTWWGLLWLNSLVIFLFWWNNSSETLLSDGPGALIALGRLAGLVAAYAVLIQFFTIGRAPWLEKIFGLDKLSRFHHKSGKTAIVFIVLHPILLSFGYGYQTGLSPLRQFISLQNSFVLWATIAVILFVIVIFTSIQTARRHLPYEMWYFIHLLVYLAIFLAFWHQIKVGSDLLAHRLFYGYWVLLYILVLGSHITFRLVRPAYLYFRHQFTVSQVVPEEGGATSVYITGRNLKDFHISPGQFMFFRFLAPYFWWQSHPFSLSIAPAGTELRITVKALGDYTKQIPNLKPGTKVYIDGPYGVFTEKSSLHNKYLFLAGGIGITPIRSLFEQTTADNKDAILLYANKSLGNAILKEELENLNQKKHSKIIHVISDDASYRGEKGHIDQEKLNRLVPDIETRDIYLCGPSPMIKTILAILEKMGIPKQQIHYEIFSL